MLRRCPGRLLNVYVRYIYYLCLRGYFKEDLSLKRVRAHFKPVQHYKTRVAQN